MGTWAAPPAWLVVLRCSCRCRSACISISLPSEQSAFLHPPRVKTSTANVNSLPQRLLTSMPKTVPLSLPALFFHTHTLHARVNARVSHRVSALDPHLPAQREGDGERQRATGRDRPSLQPTRPPGMQSYRARPTGEPCS